MNNTLTLHGVSRDRLATAAAEWEAELSHLPRPYIAVIAGGDSGPFTFGPGAATRLARQASDRVRESGGSLLVSTSSRTSREAVEALQAGIDVSNYFYTWQRDDAANPYFGMLALADQLIVTADSIAMLSEACATGSPVWMFDLGGMRDGYTIRKDFRWSALLYGILLRWFWQPLSRDITLVHQQLLESGRVSWLGDPQAVGATTGTGDIQRAVQAVRALLDETDLSIPVE